MRKTKIQFILFIKKIVVAIIIATFVTDITIPCRAFAQSEFTLPPQDQMVSLTPAYEPAVMKGLKLFPENPLRFDFIIDTGDSGLKGEDLKEESTKLIKYFLTSLTIPENNCWVNLSPYEKDRIVPNEFGITEMGRDLLAQDYLLKQITSSLMYPEKKLGKKFWDKVYDKAFKEFGTTEIPMDTFNKVWIVPEKAVVYANGDTVFVVKSRLKVMLDEDYVALNGGKEVQEAQEANKSTSTVASDMIRQVIIPAIEKEVNTGKNFASLRQIYNSLILATWYKMNLKKSLLSKVFINKNKIAGAEVDDKQIKEKIYKQYVESFKKGVYDYIKEDFDPLTQQIIPRKYFSGGMQLAKNLAMVIQGTNTVDRAMLSKGNMVLVKSAGRFVDSAMILDGKEINDELTYNQKKIADDFFEKNRNAKSRQAHELILPNGKKIGNSDLEKILKDSLINSIKEIYIEKKFIVTDQLIDSFRNKSIFQVRGSAFYLQEGGNVPWKIVSDLDIFLYLPQDLLQFIDLHGIQTELRKKFNEKARWYLNFGKSKKKVMLDFFPKDRLFAEKYARLSKPYRKDMWYVVSPDVINAIESEIDFNGRDYLRYLLSEYHELIHNVRSMTQGLFLKQGKILNRLIELAVLRGDSGSKKELLRMRQEIYQDKKKEFSNEELLKLVDDADPGFFNLGLNDKKILKAYLFRHENDKSSKELGKTSPQKDEMNDKISNDEAMLGNLKKDLIYPKYSPSMFWRSGEGHLGRLIKNSFYGSARVAVGDPGEILHAEGAVFCNYCILKDIKTGKGAIIHTSNDVDFNFMRNDVFGTVFKEMGIQDKDTDYYKNNVIVGIVHPGMSDMSEGIERMLYRVLADFGFDTKRIKKDVNSAWRDNEVKFLIDEGVVVSAQNKGKRILRYIKLDKAMIDQSNPVGGIDLNPSKIDFESRGEGIKYKFPYTEKEFENMDFQGLQPVILDISPLTDLPLFLGLDTSQDRSGA